MADERAATPDVSEADIRSLAGRLEAFSQTLTVGEQVALTMLIQRATAPAHDEVAGYGFLYYYPAFANAFLYFGSATALGGGKGPGPPPPPGPGGH